MKHQKQIEKDSKRQRISPEHKVQQAHSPTPYFCILVGRTISAQKAMVRVKRWFARSATSWYTAARIPLFCPPSQASQRQIRDNHIRNTFRWVSWVNRARLGLDQ